MNPPSHNRASRFLGPALIVLAAALAAAPILLHGSYCGDDFEFHVVSWFDVQQNWMHGIPYPHWMPSANYGAGEPRFMFYPPLTWMLGAALGFVLPWPLVPVALVFLLLAATGLAVRVLALEALPDAPATLAGCAALFSGFALFTAYERTAFAELTGGFWIPLLLLFALRDRSPTLSLGRRTFDGSTLPLALIFAGCWLSNGPVGVMSGYLLAAIAITASLFARSWAHLLRAFIASALGLALAGLYLIPAASEQGWVDLRAAVDYPVFNIQNNWLFAHHTEPLLAPFGYFLQRASMLTVCMIGAALLSLVAVLLRAWLYRQSASSPFALALSTATLARRWWIPVALIPAAVLFLQFPISLPLWNLLPRLRFLQYPWRWVLVVEAPVAIFFAAAVWPAPSSSRRLRHAVATFCTLFFLCSTFFAAKTFLRSCQEGDTVADLLAMYSAGGGLEGTDEYQPPGSDHWKIAIGLPDACFTTEYDTLLGVATPDQPIPAWHPDQGTCQVTATAQLRQPEHLRISMIAPRPGFLILRLLRYPAWRITVNGRTTGPLDPRDDGLVAVPVPQGPVDLTADWATTPDAVAGRLVSGLALLLLLGLGLFERRLSQPHSE
jgi:hypothetical protein